MKFAQIERLNGADTMNQLERLDYLINYLFKEQEAYQSFSMPQDLADKKQILRAFMNIRPPMPISQEFITIQDKYLQTELASQKITTIEQLKPLQKGIYLWQGDITKLQVDAIVNAGNRALLGCFIPCHNCIDNAIHSFAGVQLRLACQCIMEQQNGLEPVGKAKITKGYNLPAKYVVHTVGPVVNGQLLQEDCDMLKSCYLTCLKLAQQHHLKSVAFCCISTGEFHFPNEIAGQIAINTVIDYLRQTDSKMEVIFNVFKDKDFKIYQRLLQTD